MGAQCHPPRLSGEGSGLAYLVASDEQAAQVRRLVNHALAWRHAAVAWRFLFVLREPVGLVLVRECGELAYVYHLPTAVCLRLSASRIMSSGSLETSPMIVSRPSSLSISIMRCCVSTSWMMASTTGAESLR